MHRHQRSYATDGWSPLVAKGLIIVIVYAVLTFFAGIDKDERTNIVKRIGMHFDRKATS